MKFSDFLPGWARLLHLRVFRNRRVASVLVGLGLAVAAYADSRMSLQYWRANDYPDRYVGGHYENQQVWIPGYWDYPTYQDDNGDWQTDYDNGTWVEGHYEIQSVWVETYAADGFYGSSWTTTAGTFGDPSTDASTAYDDATAIRGFVLNSGRTDHTFVVGDYVAYRAYAAGEDMDVHFCPPPTVTWSSQDHITNGSYVDCRYMVGMAGVWSIKFTSGNIPWQGVNYHIAVGGTAIPPLPAVTAQPGPLSQTAANGSRVSYSVTASNGQYYQWYWQGAKVNFDYLYSAASSTLVIDSAVPSESGSYRVLVTNDSGSVFSNSVSLTVNPAPPTITTQPSPSNQTAAIGANVTYSVVATSTGLSYQWRKAQSAITGATGASYTIQNAQAANAGSYDVVVTNAGGSATSNAVTLAVANVAPTVTAQPASQAVSLGSTATLSVTVNGTSPLTYQWKKDGTDIVGATASTYTINSMQAADTAAYTVVVRNAFGSVISSPAYVALNSAALVRLALQYWQLNDYPDRWVGGYYQQQSVWVDGHMEYPTYQDENGDWQYDYDNGTYVPGGYVQQWVWMDNYAADGLYGSSWTTSTGTYGDPTTDPAGAVGIAPTDRGYLLGNFRGGQLTFRAWGYAPNGNCSDIRLATYSGKLDGTSYYWYDTYSIASGTCASGSYVQGQIYTTLAKIEVSYTGGTSGAPASGKASYYVMPNLTPAPQIFAPLPASLNATVNTSVTLSVMAGATVPPTYQWLKNGSAISGATNADYAIASIQFADGGGSAGLPATYTVQVSNSNGSIVSSPCVLRVWNPGVPPSFSLQPASFAAVAGASSYGFWPSVLGGQPMTFQWYKNDAPINGATSQWLSFTPPQISDSGVYKLVATNAAGPLSSNYVTATITPTSPPEIKQQPTSQTVDYTGTATFTVSATSVDGVTAFQWFKDDREITGAMNSTLTISNAQATDGGTYKVRVNNWSYTVMSDVATLTVNGAPPPPPTPPTITTQPGNVIAAVGANATFSVAASGTAPLAYQWKKDTNTAISGATSSTLTLTNVQSTDAGSYVVEVSNGGVSTASTPGLLTLVTEQPQNQAVIPGSNAAFTVSTTGPATLSYQWLKNGYYTYDGGNVSGANTSSLSIAGATPLDSGTYAVIISCAGSNFTTAGASLAVTNSSGDSSPPSVPSNLGTSNVALTSLTLSWSASTDNVGVTGYEVQNNGFSLGMMTSTSVSVANLTPGTVQVFSVRAVDAAGNWSAWSPPLTFTMADDTTAPTIPGNVHMVDSAQKSVKVAWDASLDNVGTVAYEVLCDGYSLGFVGDTFMTIPDLDPGSTHHVQVRAGDGSSNWSALSDGSFTVTIVADTAAPSQPSGLAASDISQTYLTLNWNASTDDIGVTGYNVLVNGSTYYSTAGTSLVVGGLTPDTAYTLTVRAVDAAGNQSNQASISARTSAVIPTGTSGALASYWVPVSGSGRNDEVIPLGIGHLSDYSLTVTPIPDLGGDPNTDYNYYTSYADAIESFTPDRSAEDYTIPNTSDLGLVTVNLTLNFDFSIEANSNYAYQVFTDSGIGPGVSDPATWTPVTDVITGVSGHQVFPLSSYDINLDGSTYTLSRFFLVRYALAPSSMSVLGGLGGPISGVISSTPLGGGTPGGVLAAATGGLPIDITANGSIILRPMDIVGAALGGKGRQSVWTVLNELGVQVPLPLGGVLDKLQLGTDLHGHVRVGVQLDNDGHMYWLDLNIKIPGQKIMLLLHGLNSKPETWNDYVGATFNGRSRTINNGNVEVPGAPDANDHGVRCYRVRFGAFDSASTRMGLDSPAVTGHDAGYTPCGDFESLTELGSEVNKAVATILKSFPSAEVVLLGHSRGGLAARSFLQSSDPTFVTQRSAVTALLTTGSPHQGSPLGRIWQYLSQPGHNRTADPADWRLVDWLKDTEWYIMKFDQLDIRRPTIDDMATGSTPISNLNATIAALPAAVRYSELAYTGVHLGTLSLGHFSVLEHIGGAGYQLTPDAAAYVLGAGNTPATFNGDGIVPSANMVFHALPGFGGLYVPRVFQSGVIKTADILHVGEPKQAMDINTQLQAMVPAWFR